MCGKNNKRRPFSDTADKNDEALDAVSTDTTELITPADHDGNVYLQLLVDVATGNIQGSR